MTGSIIQSSSSLNFLCILFRLETIVEYSVLLYEMRISRYNSNSWSDSVTNN